MRAVSRVLAFVRAFAGPIALTVAAEPDAALLASAAALRRLGARITRYDTETGTLEARRGDETVQLAVSASGLERSRVDVTSARAARSWVRRLRNELAHPTKEAPR